jgi:hypothetical protein
MSKRNGKSKNIHSDNLKPSSEDVRALAESIEPRFVQVCETYGRKWGDGQVPRIDAEMQKHFERWRQVVVRHRQGDYRHSLSEYKSMKAVAQWTVDENCKLCRQPSKLIEWSD